jgi:hypothetical protein
MKKLSLNTVKVIALCVIAFSMAVAGFLFREHRTFKETVVVSEGCTEVKKLSDYSDVIKGTVNDCNVYIFDSGVPGGNYECADGEWVFFAMGNPVVNRPKFHRIIGYPELDTDPRFQDHNRWENRYEYYEYFRKGFLTKTADEWVKIADEEDLPLVRMAHFKDVSKDAQAWANGFLENVEFRTGNVDVMPSSPIEMRSAQVPPTRPAPAAGTHTAAILRSLGYTEAQVEAMLASGAAVAAKG